MITEDTLLQMEAKSPGTLAKVAHASVDAVYRGGNNQWLATAAASWAQWLSGSDYEDERTDNLLREWGFPEDSDPGEQQKRPDRSGAGTPIHDRTAQQSSKLPDLDLCRKNGLESLRSSMRELGNDQVCLLVDLGEHFRHHAADPADETRDELFSALKRVAARRLCDRPHADEPEAQSERKPEKPDDEDGAPAHTAGKTNDQPTVRLPLRPGMRVLALNEKYDGLAGLTEGVLLSAASGFGVIKPDPWGDGKQDQPFAIPLDAIYLCREQPASVMEGDDDDEGEPLTAKETEAIDMLLGTDRAEIFTAEKRRLIVKGALWLGYLPMDRLRAAVEKCEEAATGNWNMNAGDAEPDHAADAETTRDDEDVDASDPADDDREAKQAAVPAETVLARKRRLWSEIKQAIALMDGASDYLQLERDPGSLEELHEVLSNLPCEAYMNFENGDSSLPALAEVCAAIGEVGRKHGVVPDDVRKGQQTDSGATAEQPAEAAVA